MHQRMQFKVENSRRQLLWEDIHWELIDLRVRAIVIIREIEREIDHFIHDLDGQLQNILFKTRELEKSEIFEWVLVHPDFSLDETAHIGKGSLLGRVEVKVFVTEKGLKHWEELEVVPDVEVFLFHFLA